MRVHEPFVNLEKNICTFDGSTGNSISPDAGLSA
jgi:hypothetical protein